jgi:hypothetical protein
MDPHWLKLRWPITVLALGTMLIGLLMRAGQMQGVLSMPDGVKIEPASSVRVRVTEQAPIDLSVKNTTPVEVNVSNPKPIEIKMSEDQPMEVDVKPKAPVNVKIGL